MNAIDLNGCVHCGLCLSSCPTYLVTGSESESPRGRVVLLQALGEGAPLSPDAVTFLDTCLDCGACEAVCPAHVPVGHAVEAFRASHGAGANSLPVRVTRRWFGSRRGFHRFRGVVRWSRTGWGTRLLKLAGRVSPPMAALNRTVGGLPAQRVPGRPWREGPESETGTVVLLFSGCVMDTVYAETMEHTADLLRFAGYRVTRSDDQVCCGALHRHAGDHRTAAGWAARNRQAFLASGAQVLAVNAAGCGAAMKEYDRWLGVEAGDVAGAVRDVVELVTPDQLPGLPLRAESVTVHDACHLAHAQGLRQEIRALLTRVGYRIVEMPEADVCCGSAGLYSFVHGDVAESLQRRKVGNIPADADVVATSNPGCLLQIQAGARAMGRSVRVEHWVDLVWRALADAGYGGGRVEDGPRNAAP
jgi:glycolate oxidase iron-sulfur subunit